MSQGRSVCVLDKVTQVTVRSPLVPRQRTSADKRHKHRRPVAARVGFGQRATNGAAIAHLNIGNSRGAVMENGNCSSRSRCLDLRMPRQRTEAKRVIVFLNVGRRQI